MGNERSILRKGHCKVSAEMAVMRQDLAREILWLAAHLPLR